MGQQNTWKEVAGHRHEASNAAVESTTKNYIDEDSITHKLLIGDGNMPAKKEEQRLEHDW